MNSYLRWSGLSGLICLSLVACEGSLGGGNKDDGSTQSSGDGDEDGNGDIAGDGDTPDLTGDFAPSAPVLRVLTPDQYANVARDLFGSEAPVPDSLQAVPEVNGSQERGAKVAVIQASTVNEFERAGNALATYLFENQALRDEMGACSTTTATDPCISEFLTEFASRAWRRPLLDEEVSALTGLVVELSDALGDVDRAFELTVSTVLESGHFLYRTELGEAHPEVEGVHRYSSVEMASRLSFALWGGLPDDELWQAGLRGDLVNAEHVRAHALRLVQSERAEDTLVSFLKAFYGTNDLDNHSKNIELFPGWNTDVSLAVERSAELQLRDLVRADADFRDVLTGTTLYVSPLLADVYDLTVPAGTAADEFVPVSAPDRPGVIGSFAWMTRHAESDLPSVMGRGNAVLGGFLCSALAFPDAEIDELVAMQEAEDLPPAPEGLSEARAEAFTRMQSNSCGGCHRAMDPIGLALESFDAIGRAQSGVDTSGEFGGQPFDGIEGLVNLLAEDEQATECIAERLYEHLNGRSAKKGDVPVIDLLDERFAEEGFSIRELLVEAVVSDGFRFLEPVDPTTPAAQENE